MPENKKSLQLVLIIVTAVVFAAVLFALNTVTAPLIEANNKGAEFEPLYKVMPQADSFEQLSLENLPETIRSVWKETSGMGYVVRCASNKGFTGEFIELTMGVGTDGKICGMSLDAYPETKDFGTDTYPQSYVGQDSTLADVGIVSGVTFSSSAFRNSVIDAFAVLVDNGFIGAGVKGADQLINEMLPSKAGFLRNASGIAQVEEIPASDPAVKAAWKSHNSTGAAFWINTGADYLAVVHVNGQTAVYDIDGNKVSEPSVEQLAKSEASKVLKTSAAKDIKKQIKLVPAGAVLTEVIPQGVFNTVNTASKAETAEGVFYVFTCKPYGFSNEPMSIHVVIDENGAIYALTADQLIIEAEYFNAYTLDASSYKAGFAGLTEGSYSYDNAVISGATVTTQAVDISIKDAFEAFNAIKGGKN